MTSMNLRIKLPHITPGGPDEMARFEPLVMALECLTKINQWHFRRGEAVPLYSSGVRYREEPPGQENWNDCLIVAHMGYGDCEDLAAYLCAELRETKGIAAECVIKEKWLSPEAIKASGYPIVPKDGLFLVHCLVRLPDGTILDPSADLGMKGEY